MGGRADMGRGREIGLARPEVDDFNALLPQPVDRRGHLHRRRTGNARGAVGEAHHGPFISSIDHRGCRRGVFRRVCAPGDLVSQPLLYHVGNEPVDAAAEREHLFDEPRADVTVLLRRHHENGFDFIIQAPVHERHLELELEVRHGAKPAHDDLRATPLHVIHEQAVEGIDLDIRQQLEDRAGYLHALRHREQRGLLRIDENRDDDPIEQPRAPGNDIDVTVRQRIEGSRINGNGWHREVRKSET